MVACGEEITMIRRLFTMGKPHTYAKDEIILGNDHQPDGVYFISSGYVKVYSISDNGDEYIHLIYGHDEVFPIVWAYLGQAQESLFFQALGNTLTWRIPRAWFINFTLTNPDLSFALSTLLAKQFQVYSDRVDNLEYKKASERIAYRLLFLASRFGVRSGSTITIDAPITHDLFANSINLARETVSRQLERLQKEHIIRAFPQHFEILDVSALMSKLSPPNNLRNWAL